MANLTCDHGSIRACMMRIAELSATGATPSGNDLYVSNTLVELVLEPEVREGESIEQQNGCGDYCIDFKGDDITRWWNATLKICEPDAELSALIASGFVALATGADTVGGKFPPLGRAVPSSGVSIELWSVRLAEDGQTQDGTFGYYQWALPRTRSWRPTGRTFGNTALQNEFVGRVFANSNWGNGPANDWGTHDTTDSPLIYIADAAPPVSACGLQVVGAQT
ncbi:MAG TPA: hypothetical protein VI916_02610 [Acidimicrobiia bacterium]|nr:hypothetical protein [Acidimicrobiia bacterium]